MTSFRRTDLAVRLMGLVSSRDRPDAPLRLTGTAVCLHDLVLSRAEPVPVAERLGLWFPCQEADQDPANRQALRDQILQQPMPSPVGAAEHTEDGVFLSPGLLPDIVLLIGEREMTWLGPCSTKTAQVMTLDALMHQLAPELVETGNTTEALLARFAAEDYSGVHPASDLVRIHAAARLIEALWTGQSPKVGLPYRL
ncbi:hypothetical protein Gbth_016_015 [Gluconobacter thailandicus F149-1 = NBRC 100600]|uniref:Uncharacterized protein n=1 Tax=Gluconobacter thailandicus NBRC 3257 TaxID=1381097 RepID=A0ABQ0ISU2_GLUTH|nr:hypothetical protein [Gluconobacter thailandicus]KXV54791.1 hypothetical protein AD946_01455 [Gluconobacter thailandicus]GAC89018.1 hypothetical protein NBRC3255_2679 [Gluconobacter thailandicus NBRC 3255]GAD25272.1 hypothetical protein NBRC3257_0271 [Gluconobacter thailandicus NBRC 3257]GAN92816.1 hypothetical protein Gbth_016_015 [Gluconobacter thailandicus F149-1 = NBRC 100600]GBR57137.1 hypothetical protein AA100600_0103 [Gluconobacter thailandicus F149-1 = NBRC 100600]